MSKKKIVDDRKQLLLRYRIDEQGCVSFIDPRCDEIPARLFGEIMKSFSSIEEEWNKRITNKVFDLPAIIPEVEYDEPYHLN